MNDHLRRQAHSRAEWPQRERTPAEYQLVFEAVERCCPWRAKDFMRLLPPTTCQPASAAAYLERHG